MGVCSEHLLSGASIMCVIPVALSNPFRSVAGRVALPVRSAPVCSRCVRGGRRRGTARGPRRGAGEAPGASGPGGCRGGAGRSGYPGGWTAGDRRPHRRAGLRGRQM